MSTVAAVSTPRAAGGISVIRISGEDAFSVAVKIFRPISRKDISGMKGYTCAYGRVCDESGELDDAVLTVFRAPKSYTGEDVIEISCHGGIFVTNKVLRAVCSAGAVPAQAGEFTKRAFLNGKMTLTEAEAVMDIISAEGEQYHKCALAAHEGALFSRIKAVSDSLVSILGELGAWVDYPDEDIPAVEEKNLLAGLTDQRDVLNRILQTYDGGKILREGIETVIAGRPNVGKSTLMNLLTGFERSIVTDIAGTTRDIVEETVRLGDILLRLSDTAGIRETDDIVEEAGVKLARKKLDSAQLVLAVFDNSQLLDNEDKELILSLKGKTALAILNKSDVETKFDKAYLEEHFSSVIEISAKNGTGIEELKQKAEELFHTNQIDANAGVIANERQKQCVDKAISSLDEAIAALSASETLDAVTVLIDEAADFLLELTGEKASEAVVNEVFSHFCVGK